MKFPSAVTPAGSGQIGLTLSARATVMVVDDHADARILLEHIVRRLDQGVSVESFGFPGDAALWATRHVADMVLVDYMMPEMDGLELGEPLPPQAGFEQGPIVM